ncbi:hypothetical protein CHS0354_016171 [Potamilus streckersoni]|uniref:Uncharacterized protein n=1 Tax=Potamilus streckersoni TaxID=2493646 RepID=A0AAE0VLQ1_9BIVA|nr:hypothetical protein CHS0354_016171 [Potamilus streckersoni]
MAKSREASVEAAKKLKDTAMQFRYLSTKLKCHVGTPRKSYVAKKLRSPHITPRQAKRQRVTPLEKVRKELQTYYVS